MGLVHFDDAPSYAFELGHVRGRWSLLGEAAGCNTVGVRRIELPAGAWSTPAHQHGRSEELFYVLSGRGLSWVASETAEVAAGDCILYPARGGERSLHALEPLDSEATPVRPGHVIVRPAASGISHWFRAGAAGLTYLAYGPREAGDVCYYPTSRRIGFGSIGVMVRVESLDYWDGED